MSTHTQLWTLPATAIAALVARGEISALEVVESAIARIDAVNPAVNAVSTRLDDSARNAARAIDRRRAAGERLGPLAGAPFTVKENIHVAGSATTHGVPAFREMMATADAPPVRRLRAADAIPVARTNMADLAMGLHTVSQLYGDTVNPWDATRTPGGTSGGDGAAVATGMAALGLGNDSGGSVRIPAAFCGVAALKPGHGRFAADHRIAGRNPTLASQLFPVDGPLARTVADLHAAFAVLAGADPADPRSVPAPLAGAPGTAPIRVGVVADPGGTGVHPHVRAAVEAAASALQEAGYAVEAVDVPRLEESLDCYGRMILTEFSQFWPSIRPLLHESSRHWIDRSMEQREPVDLAGYIQLTADRFGLQRDWQAFLEDYPLVVGPVFTEPPFAIGFETRGAEEAARAQRAMRLATATTFIGLPAVAVPTGLAEGLPMGVQVIGQPYREDLCLAAAAAIEARQGTLTPIDPRGCLLPVSGN